MREHKGTIRRLVKSFDCSQRKMNLLLVLTISIGITAIFFLLGLAEGRIDAEKVQIAKANGTLANVTVKNISYEEISDAKSLDYIEKQGVVQRIGVSYKRESELGSQRIGVATVTDKNTFEEFYEGSYKTIKGSFPQNEDEVMLSLSYTKCKRY